MGPWRRRSLRRVCVQSCGPRGGAWPPWESDRVVRREPRWRPCVRRAARGQRRLTEDSEPEGARFGSARSLHPEHPGARLQHVSTAPSPSAPCQSSLSPVLCPPHMLSLCLWFPPRACRDTPTQSQVPKVPYPQKSMVYGPLGGRGKPRHRRNSAACLGQSRNPAHSGLGRY